MEDVLKVREMTYGSGRVFRESIFADGSRMWETFKENGKIELREFIKDEMRIGVSTSFFEDGSVSAFSTYSDGVRHGPYKCLDKDGSVLFGGIYRYDKRHGPWKRR